MTFRIGHGFDAHRLVPDRPLILCGVTIDYPLGLLGHSDADVGAHVVMDALLGAMALGSIGDHFPDSDPQYKNSNSMKLLQNINSLVIQNGYSIMNLDLTFVAQAPKLQPYILKMRRSLSDCLGLKIHQINVKATTTEKMGYEGRKEGVSAHCVSLISQL